MDCLSKSIDDRIKQPIRENLSYYSKQKDKWNTLKNWCGRVTATGLIMFGAYIGFGIGYVSGMNSMFNYMTNPKKKSQGITISENNSIKESRLENTSKGGTHPFTIPGILTFSGIIGSTWCWTKRKEYQILLEKEINFTNKSKLF